MRSTYHLDLAAQLARKPSRAAHLIAAAALLIVSALGAALVSGPALASVESEAFIQKTVDDGYEILNSTTLSDEERSMQFQEFMLSLTDMRRIASFTLGPYVNRASETDLEEFFEAFTDYAVTVYEDRLSRYAGQTIIVAGSNDGAADDSVVNAIVYTPNDEINPNQQSINVAFRVREDANGNPIIIDMQVEGVWLAINQRADFTSYLQQNNGSVPALSSSLRRQAERIRSSDGT
ncbi:MAG: ABC transporter substrate-binding protein [Micropepsaceae bacterium]